ncbi:MAG: hypothetical protein LBR10_08665 [Prevotellaceae bacterium]|jgi:hypothetical protein|nr:hypothetical protein [Prevotellaceae bacterium]
MGKYRKYNKSILEYEDVFLAVEYAKKRGFQIGFKIGFQRGFKIGIEKAKKRVREKFILNAYRNKKSIEDIAKFMGITVKEVEYIVKLNISKNE